MRARVTTILLLAVTGIAGAVLLLTRPAASQPTGAKPPEQSVELLPHRAGTVSAESAVAHGRNSPRRHDGLGRPMPFREASLDSSLADFLRHAQQGQVFSLEPFAGTRFLARVTGRGLQDDVITISAAFEGRPARDRMFLSWRGDRARGLLMLPSENLAYEIIGTAGAYTVREWLYKEVICATPLGNGAAADTGIPRPERRAARLNAARITTAEIPALQSRPGAAHVVYLDFDGETVTNSLWAAPGATIVAPAARMTASQVQETWERVCRDFEPFEVNITTVRADYDKADIARKIHCVITGNDQAAPGAGGVAFLNSFSSTWPGDKVCWSFQDYDPKDCAEVISHELGHTFGLNHDGRSGPFEEYYAGHGSGETGWAPIMGVGYYRRLTQWSKGEYASANNREDDIAIIASSWNLPRAADDHGNSSGGATAVNGERADGTVTTDDDTDFFNITLDAGIHTIFLTPSAHGNIDLELQVQSASGTVIARTNPPEELAASANFELTARQNVVLRVAGRGKPEVLATGYSGYGSLGSYSLTGFGRQEQPPSAPVGLSTARVSGTQVRLSWSPTPSAQSYAVYRDGVLLSLVTTGTEFLDATAAPSTNYNYSVEALNSFGSSPPSLPAAVKTPAFDEFIMDGQPDFGGYLLSNPGMTVYAAVRGSKLYVATWSPGDNGSGFGSDHFVLVGNELLPSATAPAPWAKSGLIAIAANKPYLAGESVSTYAAWNNTKGPTSLSKARLNSGVIEGVIDLVAEFGSLPENVYLAAVAYGTRDGDGINSQAPTGNGNNHLEPNEFLRVPITAAADRKLNGTFDVLDAERAFTLATSSLGGGNQPVLRWPVVPGRRYQVQSRAALESGKWENLLPTPRTAGTSEWEMQFTDTNAPTSSKFYRVTQPQ